jgi:hypothetical protein
MGPSWFERMHNSEEECSHLLGTSVKEEMEQVLYLCIVAQLDGTCADPTSTIETSNWESEVLAPGSSLDRVLEHLDALQLSDLEDHSLGATEVVDEEELVELGIAQN